MSSRTVTREFALEQLPEVEQWAIAELRSWGISGGQLRAWLSMARAHVAGTAELVLEYDQDAGLLSCDVWSGGRRAFGADDWVG